MVDFDVLIDRIYQAAVEPDDWPSVLRDLGASVSAPAGIILTRHSDAWLGWRYTPELEGVTAYLTSTAAQHSQSTARLMHMDRAGFVHDGEIFTREEYLADPMMSQWGTQAGLHHGAATAIHAPSGELIVIQLNRRSGQSAFSREDIGRLDSFRPHLARAGFLAARWRLQQLRAAAEALALVGLPAAVLGANGNVLATNALIEGMNSHLVWLPHNRVGLMDSSATALLQQCIARIGEPGATSVRSFPARGDTGKPVVVHMIPITGRARDLFGGGVAVLVITPIEAPAPPEAALIRGLFDLTPAEARVATGVSEGLTTSQIATRDGVSSETVRVQLKAVFGKTGVSRQSQLARLFAGIPSYKNTRPAGRKR